MKILMMQKCLWTLCAHNELKKKSILLTHTHKQRNFKHSNCSADRYVHSIKKLFSAIMCVIASATIIVLSADQNYLHNLSDFSFLWKNLKKNFTKKLKFLKLNYIYEKPNTQKVALNLALQWYRSRILILLLRFLSKIR